MTPGDQGAARLGLSELLLSGHTDDLACAILDLDERVGLRWKPDPRIIIQIVLSGSVVAGVPGSAERRALGPGEFVLANRHMAHELGPPGCTNWLRPPPLDGFILGEEPARIAVGSGGSARILVTRYGHKAGAELLLGNDRPELVFSAIWAWLSQPADPAAVAARFERECRGPGARAFISSAVRMMQIVAFRPVLADAIGYSDVDLRGLGLSQVSMARRLFAADPARRWTLGAIARQVGMSRTAFSERFHHLVGDTPMNYLLQLRLSRAIGLLASGIRVNQVATATGYGSPSSFARAFRQHYGVSPRDWQAVRLAPE